MAAKKARSVRPRTQETTSSEMTWTEPAVSPKTSYQNNQSLLSSKPWLKWVLLAVVVLGLVALWWWKTSTWPVVAMVGNSPITRYEIEQSLFKQYGQSAIEGLITQKQIEAELDRQGVRVEGKEIDAKIDEIKTSLGPTANFDEELKSRGLDMNKLRSLIEIQLRLNKAVEGKASVSAQEVDAYVKENSSYLTGKTDAEKRVEAENVLKQDKLNAEIENWVEEAKKKSSVWRLYPLPTQPAPAGQSGAPVQQDTTTPTPSVAVKK